MLIDDLYRLPLGSRVRSVENSDGELTGILESGVEGKKYVRWNDGTRTAEFATIRENDEYIASYIRIDLGAAGRKEIGGPGIDSLLSDPSSYTPENETGVRLKKLEKKLDKLTAELKMLDGRKAQCGCAAGFERSAAAGDDN